MKKIIFSFSIVFIYFFFATLVNAATLNLLSEKDTYKIGDTFDVNVKIDSENDNINGAQTTIKFDNTILDVVTTDKTGSIFDWWLSDPTIASNQISFVAASTSGFTGKSLQVLKIRFKVKGAGVADLTLGDSAITSADGSGSNVLTTSNNVKITLAASVGQSKPTQINRVPIFAIGTPVKPVISVPLFPDQTKWNNTSIPFFVNWKLPEDVSDVAISLDELATTVPTQSEGQIESKEFSSLADGVYYLHARYKNNIGWGPIQHYKIMNDTTPPTRFSIFFQNGNPTDFPTPTIIFKSTDSLSGIMRHEVYIDNNSPIVVNDSTLALPLQIPGKHKIKVTIYDNAGNSTSSSNDYEIISIDTPVISFTNTKVFTGEGGFFISGTANPKYKVRVVLKDQKGNPVYTETVLPNDRGEWNLNINTAFKKQAYHFEVATVDDRGAVSTIVKSAAIKVEDQPVLSIGNLNISLSWFFILFIFIVLAAFAFGIIFWRDRQEKISRRVFIAEHDVRGLIISMKEDLEKMKSYTKDNVDLQKDETFFLNMETVYNNLKQNVDKIQKYVINDIEEISKK